MTAMTEEQIHAVKLPQTKERKSLCLMDQEIAGTRVICHVLPAGESLTLPPCEESVRIVFVCSGAVSLGNGEKTAEFAERGVFVGLPQYALELAAQKDACILELCHWLTEREMEQLRGEEKLPYALRYADAHRYLEECKSPKTTSRMLIPQRLIPRFAMGSVETYGTDRIEKHTHPMLEQYFFGLGENDCLAMIDDLEYPFGNHTLLHIPLGSNHGIRLEEQHSCHYLWMDFLLNEEALQYMDGAHTVLDA